MKKIKEERVRDNYLVAIHAPENEIEKRCFMEIALQEELYTQSEFSTFKLWFSNNYRTPDELLIATTRGIPVAILATLNKRLGCYVKCQFRRKGIGTLLVGCLENNSEYETSKHNETSFRFWNASIKKEPL